MEHLYVQLDTFMTLLLVISVFMIVTGSAFSILRDPSTIDYCKTIVKDGRRDSHAQNVVAMYKIGSWLAAVGLVMLSIVATIMATQ